MLALRGDAELHGAMVALGAPALSGRRDGGGLVVETGGASSTEIAAKLVVNAAGLGSQAFARSIKGMPSQEIPPLRLAKGNYFGLAKPAPFSHLIYPIPAPGGLGIHLMLDLAGQARFGPDVEWVNQVDYAVDPRRVDAFYPAIRKYWPGLPRLVVATVVFRYSTEDRRSRRIRDRFHASDRKGSWRSRLDQPFRNRVATPYCQHGYRRVGSETGFDSRGNLQPVFEPVRLRKAVTVRSAGCVHAILSNQASRRFADSV
jgi:L-2-hydroxyglutarate oxidase LhgO